MVLNKPIESLDFLYIYGTIHAKTAEYTFFSSAHGTFSGTDYMLGQNISLNKLKKTETISSIFSDHTE